MSEKEGFFASSLREQCKKASLSLNALLVVVESVPDLMQGRLPCQQGCAARANALLSGGSRRQFQRDGKPPPFSFFL